MRTRRGPASSRAILAAPLLVTALVAVSVVGPLTGKGHILLLDWVPGPHPTLPRSFFGLDGGLLTGAPFSILTAGMGAVAPAATGWLALAAFFPLAGLGMARLLPGGALERAAGALFFVVNPLVLDRAFAGHLGFLLGYALLPFAARSLFVAVDAVGPQRWRPALWIAAMTALSPHFAWIGGALLLCVLVARKCRLRDLRWGAGVVAGAGLASAYVVANLLGSYPRPTVGARDLALFHTRGAPGGRIYLDLAGLGGFWRIEPRLLARRPRGWPAILAAILVVVALGVVTSWRSPQRRPLARVLALAGCAGYVLALGDEGPTGGIFRWLYFHLPGFTLMREPQKFVSLLAVAYAAFFAAGVGEICRRLSSRPLQAAAAAMLLAAPLLYTPTLFGGLGGTVTPSRYPRSWYQADALMGPGPGKLLVLPWHEYSAFAFTGGRTVFSPAATFFRREAIVGDNVELPGAPTTSSSLRSKFLEFLYASGPAMSSFGALIAPLGVEYVAVSTSADSARYAWVAQQADLVAVMTSDDLVLYRNMRSGPPGARVSSVREVEDWGELVGLAGATGLENVAVRARHTTPGPVREPTPITSAANGRPPDGPGVHQASAIKYDVPSGAGSYVMLSEPFDPGWRLHGMQPEKLAGGTMGFPIGSGPEEIRYRRWSDVRTGYLLSTGAVLGLAAAVTLTSTHGIRRRR